ncbi:hypothetical protein [Phaffia rhodozyma]|uniref:Uncharacterized protein n=1 Tax=Phaffia rhodozyma TaxID=264483 RepID=A0A0F7SEQ2_PHARH|nr:hypothetical protein [Phaffia rhodozyma]
MSSSFALSQASIPIFVWNISSNPTFDSCLSSVSVFAFTLCHRSSLVFLVVSVSSELWTGF